jgi:hypothetical protein
MTLCAVIFTSTTVTLQARLMTATTDKWVRVREEALIALTFTLR